MTFEEAIRKQQGKKDSHWWPDMTFGHLMGAILAIHNAEEAKEFHTGYIKWLKENHPKVNAHKVAGTNIGWCFGEGMPYEDRAIWRELGIVHPYLGPMIVDPPPENLSRLAITMPSETKEKSNVAEFSTTEDGGNRCWCGYYVTGRHFGAGNWAAEIEHRIEHLEGKHGERQI
jgi:hypothetical protein